jgi:hypothetical protein
MEEICRLDFKGKKPARRKRLTQALGRPGAVARWPIFKLFKGIDQPFELGGETRLIQSAVKYWKPGKFKKI